jgi:hypothetical protein
MCTSAPGAIVASASHPSHDAEATGRVLVAILNCQSQPALGQGPLESRGRGRRPARRERSDPVMGALVLDAPAVEGRSDLAPGWCQWGSEA